jgi:hypothetical protein
MRRRLSLTAALGLVTLVVFAVPNATAITYGYEDTSNTYKNVGAFIVKAPDGKIYPICSGALIARKVFLTASHCASYFTDVLEPAGYTAKVSLDRSIPFGDLTSGGTKLLTAQHVVTNPGYNRSQSDPGDIGAIIVPRRGTRGVTPARLPRAGLLDDLAAKNGLKDAVFTPVGYGVQNRVVGGGVPYFQDQNPIPRMYAFSAFNSLNGAWLRLSQNPATGNGGTCYGDSGGPNFLPTGGGPILAAITITGDTACRSTNVDYRLDTDSARGFLQYVVDTYGVSIPIP